MQKLIFASIEFDDETITFDPPLVVEYDESESAKTTWDAAQLLYIRHGCYRACI